MAEEQDLLGYIVSELQREHPGLYMKDADAFERFVAYGRKLLRENEPTGTMMIDAGIGIVLQDDTRLRLVDVEAMPVNDGAVAITKPTEPKRSGPQMAADGNSIGIT